MRFVDRFFSIKTANMAMNDLDNERYRLNNKPEISSHQPIDSRRQCLVDSPALYVVHGFLCMSYRLVKFS